STGKEFVAQPDQQSKQNDAEEQTAGNQFFLDGQERFALHFLQLFGKFWFVGHRRLSGRQGRFHAVEEQPGDDQADPNDESEQTNQINRRQPSDPFLPQLIEVRDDADSEEAQDEEQNAEGIGTGGDGLRGRHAARRQEAENQKHQERDRVTENKIREALPDFKGTNSFARRGVN